MLVFPGGFVFPLHDFPCNYGITGKGFGYLVNCRGICVCMWVCKRGRKKEMCWRVLKFSWIALYNEWENGTLMQMKTFLEGGSQSWMLILIFSSVFLYQKIIMWHPPNFLEQSMEAWAVQRVMCSQSRTRQSPGFDYLWKAQESTPELVCLEGRSQRAQEGARTVCAQCTSDCEKNFLIL